MAEAPAFVQDVLPGEWKLSSRRSRKPGCSNIFTGVNIHQLQRLFKTAGDRDATHRAKLVWRGTDAADMEGAEKRDGDGEEREDEAGLAQALVGLRVRARNKAGFRAEGQRDHKWLRASAYLGIEEPLSGHAVEDEESPGEFLSPAEEDIPEDQNPFKPSSWRSGSARQDSARDSERYLHRILH